MANLKDVIQHNSVELIESFKKDLVGYANTLWQHDIVPVAVKDRVLDVHSADENYRASYLVTNLARKFTVLEDIPPQVDCMKILLQSLENRGEKELANKIRIELKRDFQIELQPSGAARPEQPKSEPKLDPDAIKSLVSVIKDVLITYEANMNSLMNPPTVGEFATKMHSAKLIGHAVARNNPSYHTIIDQFIAGLVFLTKLTQIEQQCLNFFTILCDIGGPLEHASEAIKADIAKEVKKKFKITFFVCSDH